jgi:hypothetical protein
MPGGREILRSIPDLKKRVLLITHDKQVIVRPKAPSEILLHNKEGEPTVMAWLSDEGKAAWDRGEDMDLNKGHFSALGDYRRLLKCEF